jgi:hypothetical protein
MKKQALIVAALLACGSGAFAQNDNSAARSDNHGRVEQHDNGNTGDKMRSGMHNLGEKVRNGMHRLGDKLHAHNDRGNDTRAMGASPSRNNDRQGRMDDAYSHWHSKQDKSTQKDERR